MQTVEGAVHAFSVKEPRHEESKEPKPAVVKTKLRIPEPDPDALAELCSNPAEAKKAMISTAKAHGKVDFPCKNGTMVVTITKAGRKTASLSTDRVTLGKLTLDARKDGEVANLEYSEPFEKETALFYCQNLGVDFVVSIGKTQAEIGD